MVKTQLPAGLILILSISLILAAFSPGRLRAETEQKKENQAQTQSSASTSETEAQGESRQNREKPVEQEEKKYKGEPGTFIFHEADIKNVLLFFAKTYKLNMVLDPGLSGKVTVRLVNVPWDQALDLILRQHGLAMVREGEILKPQKLKK
jgi:type IV pilus assembly protein PilQ